MSIEQRPDESDSAYVARRKLDAERSYLMGVTDPEKAPRLAPAMRVLRALDAWTAWDGAVAAALRASDIEPKTVENMIRKLVVHGFLLKRGEYSRVRKGRKQVITDTRALRVGTWPTH